MNKIQLCPWCPHALVRQADVKTDTFISCGCSETELRMYVEESLSQAQGFGEFPEDWLFVGLKDTGNS